MIREAVPYVMDDRITWTIHRDDINTSPTTVEELYDFLRTYRPKLWEQVKPMLKDAPE